LPYSFSQISLEAPTLTLIPFRLLNFRVSVGCSRLLPLTISSFRSVGNVVSRILPRRTLFVLPSPDLNSASTMFRPLVRLPARPLTTASAPPMPCPGPETRSEPLASRPTVPPPVQTREEQAEVSLSHPVPWRVVQSLNSTYGSYKRKRQKSRGN
jgi:hypothetical protein